MLQLKGRLGTQKRDLFPHSPLVSHSSSLTTNVIAASVQLDTSHTAHLLFKFYLSQY